MCPGLAPQELVVPEGLRPESGWGEGGSIASLQGPASPGGRGAGLLDQRSSQGNGLSTVVVGRGESWQRLLWWWGPSGGVGCGSKRARPGELAPAGVGNPGSPSSSHFPDQWSSFPCSCQPSR